MPWIQGPKSQLDTIEDLLIKWINEETEQSDQAVKCLVALGCARNSVETLIKIINVLMDTNKNLDLNLSDALKNALKIDYEDQQAKILDFHYHLCGFHYNTK